MFTYWFVFIVISIFSLSSTATRVFVNLGRYRVDVLTSIFIVLFLILGLRYNTGGDWGPYFRLNQSVVGTPLSSILNQDQAYSLLNWIGANVFGGVFIPNLVVSGIFLFGLKKFCDKLPNPALGLLISLPYLVWVVGQGYVRQAGAIGCFLWAVSDMNNKSSWNYYFKLAIAALFHKTAVLLVPFGMFSKAKILSLKNFLISLGVICFSLLIFNALAYDFISGMWNNYLTAEQSGITASGTAVRLSMTVLCALGTVLCISHFTISSNERVFWMVFSTVALALAPLYFFLPHTILDRIILYWLPLQIFFLGRLPGIFKTDLGNGQLLITVSVIFLCASVQWVWLFFGRHSSAWIPYQFFPWEYIWGSV